MDYKILFEEKKEKIIEVLTSSLQTPWGKERFNPNLKERLKRLSFEDFLEIPQIDSEVFKKDWKRFFLYSPENTLFISESGGTSGMRKRSLVPKIDFLKEFIPHKNLPNLLKNSKRPLLLTKIFVTPCSYHVIKEGLSQLKGAPLETKFFRTPKGSIKILEETDSDFIYIPLSSTLFKIQMEEWQKAYDEEKINLDKLKDKIVLFEIYGEMNYWEDLVSADKLIRKIFPKCSTEVIVPLYGLSEVLLIGKCFFNATDKKLLYKIIPSKFCLVLNDQNLPVIGKPGKIEVTSLNKGHLDRPKGTILPRYLTGDRGIIHCIEGEFYLEILGRDPDRIQFSFSGVKLGPESFLRFLNDLGNFDVQVRYKIKTFGQKKVLFLTLTKKMFDQEYLSKTKEKFIDNFKENYTELYGIVQSGLLKIVIDIKKISFEKRWSIAKKESLTKEEFEKINSDIT